MVSEKDIVWRMSGSNVKWIKIISRAVSSPCNCLRCGNNMIEDDKGYRCDKCDYYITNEQMIKDCDFIIEGKDEP